MDKISEENEKFTLINFYYYGSKDLNEPRLIKEFNDLELLKEPEKIESKPKILSKNELLSSLNEIYISSDEEYFSLTEIPNEIYSPPKDESLINKYFYFEESEFSSF